MNVHRDRQSVHGYVSWAPNHRPRAALVRKASARNFTPGGDSASLFVYSTNALYLYRRCARTTIGNFMKSYRPHLFRASSLGAEIASFVCASVPVRLRAVRTSLGSGTDGGMLSLRVCTDLSSGFQEKADDEAARPWAGTLAGEVRSSDRIQAHTRAVIAIRKACI